MFPLYFRPYHGCEIEHPEAASELVIATIAQYTNISIIHNFFQHSLFCWTLYRHRVGTGWNPHFLDARIIITVPLSELDLPYV